MHVGVYVDGYNLYYSERRWFGPWIPGWRWLSPRALAATLVEQRRNWTHSSVDRVVYCTARVDASDNPGAYIDQDVYLKALVGVGAVDHIEFGRYVARAKQVPLAEQPSSGRPRLVRPSGPLRLTGLPLTLGHDRRGADMVLATASWIDTADFPSHLGLVATPGASHPGWLRSAGGDIDLALVRSVYRRNPAMLA